VLDYTSGSFADFMVADEPGPGGASAAGPGADVTGADRTGDGRAGAHRATDDPPGDDGPADDPPGDDGPSDDPPGDDGPADDPPGDDGPSDDGTGGHRPGAQEASVDEEASARAAAGNGSSGPGTRPMEPARALGGAAEASETGGVTSTKPMDLGPRVIFPEPWRSGQADVLASLPPYTGDPAGPLRPARTGRTRALTIVLALAVLAGIGTVSALTLLRHHSSAPQAGAPSPHGTGAAPATTPASAKPTAPAWPGLPVNASGWTAPVPIDQTGLEASNAVITGLSCPRITLCYAVDSAGNVLSSTSPSASARGTWHVVAKDVDGLVAISCPTAGFCLAVDQAGNAITLSNGSWSSPVYVDARSGVFTAVSCPQPSFCVAADSGGNAFAYTGGSQAWQPFTVDTSGGGLTGVSCSGPSYCVAVDTGGGAYTYDGTSWTTAVPVDVGHALTAVSCASPSFCAATDDNGSAAILTGGQWTVQALGTTAAALACPAAGSCIATGGSGGAAVYRNGAWSPVTGIDGRRIIDTLSCPARVACTAMDRSDNVLYYAPPSSS
jgi:hypothetical protein